ncbi:glycine dehydrogenase, partial [bacterium]|nr:glycine dehydrogenase [bacterium]
AHYMAKRISELDGFSLKFKSSFFNEFVVKCSKETPEEIVERMASKNIGGGISLGRFYPNMKDCLLIAVTEMNTKEDIDNFVKELSEGAKK